VLLGIWLVLNLILGLIAQSFSDKGMSDALGSLVQPFLVGAAAWLYPRSADLLYGSGPRLAVPTRSPRFSIALTLGASFAVIVGSMLLGLILTEFGFPPVEQPRVLELVKDPRSFAILAVAAVGLAPFAEEWLFRHALFGRLAGRVSVGTAAMLSASVFALVHNNPSGFATYMWIGLVCAWAYVKTGHWLSAVFVHMANNAAVVLALAFDFSL
jgi:membrane protease YdiL (CAAX protease family)